MNSKIITIPFTESFIDRLVDHIEEAYVKKGKDLSRLAFVFGGKRPALFVKRELAKRLKGNYYPPKFFTIDEFISNIVRRHDEYTKAQDLDNCYLLYKLAKKSTPQILKGRETFAEFLPWTREILQFMEHLDLEMVESSKLLDIKANAQIGYAVPADINKLLQHIVNLKEDYHRECKKRHLYSRGYEYFRAAQLIDVCPFEEFDDILFCNFFYFHKTEEIIAKDLFERGKATLIFQGDERKWPVLSRISKKFELTIQEGESVKELDFGLKLYRGFDGHSQVAHVREILKGLKNPEDTVIVLPQPETLVPLLSEITSLVSEFNVSMGYPLKRSSFYSLFEFIFKAQTSRKDGRYYARDYLKALRHPFVKNLRLDDNASVTRILIHKIEEILTGKERTELSGSLFFKLEDLENLDDVYDLSKEMLTRLDIKATKPKLREVLRTVHDLVFRNWEEAKDFHIFAQTLEGFLNVFTKKSFLKNYPLNVNIAEEMYKIKDEFLSATFNREAFAQEEIFRIFDDKISQGNVSFNGSPLKGLQVLGLLETRSLNFENVIVIDTNEGSLPALNIYEPLIPREVMISLNLDRLELEEEIQRYQFMRLISSAKNVHLVYQESKDKEKSRFIEELIWHEQKRRGELKVIEPKPAAFEVKIAAQKKIIPKTAEMVATLRKHTFSASSVNTYLRNPIEFYYKYVLGLQEQEDLLDEPEARHVGTFVHELLQEAFTPYIGKKPKVDAKFREKFTKRFEERFEETFGRQMKTDAFLLRSVLAERLDRLLENEAENSDRDVAKILYLEKSFEDTVTLPCGDVKFRYIVDRVDELKDGTVMIIDYKTGSVDLMPKSLEQVAAAEPSREAISEAVKSFQVPLYFHYLNKAFADKPINAALYSLRTFDLNRFIKSDSTTDRAAIDKTFLDALNTVMTEIFDPAVPFVEGEPASW